VTTAQAPLELPPHGPRIIGPSALAGDPRRFATLAWTMAVLEFKLKFFGSVLGYVWQLMRPLLLFGVLYLVFTQAFTLGDDVKFYPVVLLTGIVLYTFLADATGTAVSSVLDRESIVRKIHFPRLAIPASVVLTSVFNLGLNLLAVALFFAIAGVGPHWSWLQFPFLLGYLIVLAFGLSMILSAWFVRYRDVRPIWDVVLQITFYASPVLWPLERVEVDWIRDLILHVNPLAPLLQQVRHAMIDPSTPSAAEAMGGRLHLLVPLGIVAGILAFGFYVFSRASPHIAEDL
jgi:ABC-2 type transport system permease protein